MRELFLDWAAKITGHVLALFALFITAARADWQGIEPTERQRIYFANHTSNADLPLIWSVLPSTLRRRTRPVAAADYWLKTPLRAFMGGRVFGAVLIDRRPEFRTEDPIAKIVEAMDAGYSIIIFPEGNRNMTDAPLLPLKSGLYNMARARPDVELVPTWIDNISQIMPKGEVIPVPLGCTITFGAPIQVQDGEPLDAFLARAAEAMVALKPQREALA